MPLYKKSTFKAKSKTQSSFIVPYRSSDSPVLHVLKNDYRNLNIPIKKNIVNSLINVPKNRELLSKTKTNPVETNYSSNKLKKSKSKSNIEKEKRNKTPTEAVEDPSTQSSTISSALSECVLTNLKLNEKLNKQEKTQYANFSGSIKQSQNSYEGVISPDLFAVCNNNVKLAKKHFEVERENNIENIAKNNVKIRNKSKSFLEESGQQARKKPNKHLKKSASRNKLSGEEREVQKKLKVKSKSNKENFPSKSLKENKSNNFMKEIITSEKKYRKIDKQHKTKSSIGSDKNSEKNHDFFNNNQRRPSKKEKQNKGSRKNGSSNSAFKDAIEEKGNTFNYKPQREQKKQDDIFKVTNNKKKQKHNKEIIKRPKIISSETKHKSSDFFTKEKKVPFDKYISKLMKLQEGRNVGLYVYCDTCNKTRFLPDCKDPLELPNKWFCYMNPDPQFNSCCDPDVEIAPEEEKLLIHNKYNAGSIVWAKLQGFPRWPAMVDDDPDVKSYFWLDDEHSVEPSWYNVTFFDSEKVTRAWIKLRDLEPFEVNINSQLPSTNKFYKRIQVAINDAKYACNLPLLQRLKEFSFITRYFKNKNSNSGNNVKVIMVVQTDEEIKKKEKRGKCPRRNLKMTVEERN